MFARTLFAISAFTLVAFAASPVMGTWKLNTAKSKYTGIPAPKDVTVTYTPEGAGWKYNATGTGGDGRDRLFVCLRQDNEDIKFTGYPYADSISLKGGNSSSSTATFKRDGKPAGTAK